MGLMAPVMRQAITEFLLNCQAKMVSLKTRMKRSSGPCHALMAGEAVLKKFQSNLSTKHKANISFHTL